MRTVTKQNYDGETVAPCEIRPYKKAWLNRSEVALNRGLARLDAWLDSKILSPIWGRVERASNDWDASDY